MALPAHWRKALAQFLLPDMTATHDRISVYRLKVPLVEPYRLAFGAIEWFDTIVVEVVARDGTTGLGEATVLTGYTEETIEDSWRTACATARRLAADMRCADDALRSLCVTHPFTATAFGTALEMLAHSKWLDVAAPVAVPVLGLLHAHHEADIGPEFDRLLDAGFRTIKVKVGFDVESDIAHVRRIQRVAAGRAALRIDANQGYTKEQAIRFVQALAPDGIELFEQPCAADDWESHLAVARISRLPLMLDESIYSVRDIERAAELRAARFIKVKLMKMGTLDALAASIRRIRELGMQPVLGNGVACDLGCWMEACIAAQCIDNAGEMNGYLKARSQLLAEPLRFERGAIRLQPGFRAALDHERIEALLTEPALHVAAGNAGGATERN